MKIVRVEQLWRLRVMRVKLVVDTESKYYY